MNPLLLAIAFGQKDHDLFRIIADLERMGGRHLSRLSDGEYNILRDGKRQANAVQSAAVAAQIAALKSPRSELGTTIYVLVEKSERMKNAA